MKVSRMVCAECGKRPDLKEAWQSSILATSIEDPLLCYFCKRSYVDSKHPYYQPYPIMDCMVEDKIK